MPALPIDLPQIFLLCTSQSILAATYFRRRPPRLLLEPGSVHACSTERLHGLGSSSSFGGGCARPAASSNDLIAQAQIVPSSRLEFDPKLFPPSQPQTPNRSPSWTAFFKKNQFHHICILSFQIDAEAARKTIPGYGLRIDCGLDNL